MSKEDRQPKRPSGGRPLVRRLLSSDTSRNSTVHASATESANVRQTSPAAGEPLDKSNTSEETLIPPTPPFEGAWTNGGLTSSPKSEEANISWQPRTRASASGSADSASWALPPVRVQKKSSALSISKPASHYTENQQDVPRSPSFKRWATVRKHVLPESVDETPPPTPPLPVLAPNRPSSPASSRPGTPSAPPRQFRLPRRFRQVVEQVQEVSTDSSRRFADDVLRAVLSARAGEPRFAKREREGSTPFNMTFISTATTLPSANTSTANLSRFGNLGLRRMPSISSIPSSPAALPSVGILHALLAQTSALPFTTSKPNEPLPFETDVLSLLLSPFLVDDVEPSIMSSRLNSLETFQIIVKSWPAPSNEIELQRCFWCCKAAAPLYIEKELRARILGILSSTIFAPGVDFRAESPLVLQALLQALFSLLASLSALHDAFEEASLVRELIVGALHGACGDLEPSLVLQDYGVKMRRADDAYVKDCVVELALSACLKLDAPAHRPYIAEALSEGFWQVAEAGPYPSDLAPLFARTLAQCSRAVLHYLPLPETGSTTYAKRAHLLRLFRDRLYPQAEALADEAAATPRMLVARIALRMLCMHDMAEQEEAKVLLAQWYSVSQSPWTAAFESALRQMMQEESWSSTVAVCTTLFEQLPDDFRQPVVVALLPILNERLVSDAPQSPYPELAELLDAIARDYPKLFYKPMFALAGASKDVTLANHLRVVIQLARFVQNFWIADIEMLLVSLTSGGTTPQSTSPRSRPGQLLLIMELAAHIQSISGIRKDKTTEMALAVHAKFFFTLESRLGAILNATDSGFPIAIAHCIALTALFTEIRLCLKTLRPAYWLPRMISWITNQEASSDVDSSGLDQSTNAVFNKLETVYSDVRSPRHTLGHKLRTSAIAISQSASSNLSIVADTPSVTSNAVPPSDLSTALQNRVQLLVVMRQGLACNAVALLVACSGLLSSDDYNRLNASLWRMCLDSTQSFVQARATFLLMQSAEKPESQLLDLVREDLTSLSAPVRRQGVKRIGIMLAWRFQLLSQRYITDTKTYRRPFKYARGPIAYLATDMGSSSFVLDDDKGVLKASNGTVIPAELRKRLADVGWTLDVEAVDQKEEVIKTPLSLAASQQMDHIELGLSSTYSRSMSTSAPSTDAVSFDTHTLHLPVKRRPIVVPVIAALLSELAHMSFDEDFTVSSAARHCCLDIMRDDPALISRPVLDAVPGDEKELLDAVRVLQAFSHLQRTLPPPLTHHIFNHLAGFLKTASRRADASLSAFAYSLPVLAEMSPHVSNFSVRDIRRAKVEQLLVPAGSLWFTEAAPPGSMFPRSLVEAVHGSRSLAKEKIAQITMIRVAQNMLFLELLKRHPQDVSAIRKNMSRLVLPAYSDAFDVAAKDMHVYVPQRRSAGASTHNPNADLEGLSLVLSRSHVLLVQAVLKAMPRHLNDRGELAVLIDGLNKILLAHGDDTGIVAHVLVAYMIASTRFRRIFSSSGGYTMFMPAVMKVYAEMENNEGIRAAIEYAVNRFYAVYQEAFVFQSLDVISHLIMLANNVDGEWMCAQVYTLFHSLRDGAPLLAPDYAGIHNSNRTEEQEALLIYAAEQKPQALVSILKRERSARGGEKIDIDVPEEYEAARLSPDNLVRLFLTVIGHDPGIRRAENFLHLLRFLAPNLCLDSQAHAVLKGGIEALGNIFLTRSLTNKQKVPDSAQLRSQDDMSHTVYATASSSFYGDSRSPSDLAQMRFDYLSLVACFTKAGGELDYSSPAAHRVMDLAQIEIKASERDSVAMARISTFFSEYTASALIRPTSPKMKHVLAFLATLLPLYKAYAAILDFSGVLATLLKLSKNPEYGNEPAFGRLVVNQFCAAGLDALELAISEGLEALPMESVLVKVICHATLMKGVDVVELLESRAPTFTFLSRIVLPFAVGVPTTREVERAPHWPRDAPGRAMARLMLLIAAQCEGTSPSGQRVLARNNSKNKRRSTSSRTEASWTDDAVLLPMLLQVIKVVVLRAEDELSTVLPGIWVQLGQVLKRVLVDGNAAFAISDFTDSAPTSPLSPNDAGGSLESANNPFGSSRATTPVGTGSAFARPRVVDYVLWSMLEFACLHRSPLIMQLRLAMQVGTAHLDKLLHSQIAPSPRSRRLSVFAKPRIRSGLYSGGTTPEASPYLRATDATSGSRPGSFSLGPSPTNLDLSLLTTPERTPGYARSAGTSPSSSRPGAGPRIVHLGPVQRSQFGREPFRRGSGGTGASAAPAVAARNAKIRSAALIRATYRRIRVVQQMMGYTVLLPLAEGEGEDALGEARTWTRREALEAVSNETKELQDEFGLGEEDWDEGVLVTEDLSFTSLGP